MKTPARALAAMLLLLATALPAAADCGTLRRLPLPRGATLPHALAPPPAQPPAITLLLLAGGDGRLRLDAAGCATALAGNALVRIQPRLQALGFGTVLVDAPSDLQDAEDGLGGWRGDARHAQELGRLIAALRAELGGQIWLLGTSRGTISAVNAAARLEGAAAPDGLVLSALLSVGTPRGRKPWTAQTVFDHELGAIRQPTLLLGHADDACPRSPPDRMAEVARRLGAARKLQLRLIEGGPGGRGGTGLEACEGRSPHGFTGQDAELAEAIRGFVRGE